MHSNLRSNNGKWTFELLKLIYLFTRENNEWQNFSPVRRTDWKKKISLLSHKQKLIFFFCKQWNSRNDILFEVIINYSRLIHDIIIWLIKKVLRMVEGKMKLYSYRELKRWCERNIQFCIILYKYSGDILNLTLLNW